MRLKTAYKGLHTYRFADNPLEARFAKLWQVWNSQPTCEHALLGYLLSKDNRREPVSNRDAQVAATVIQWLGSLVGTSFLSEVLNISVDNIRADDEIGRHAAPKKPCRKA